MSTITRCDRCGEPIKSILDRVCEVQLDHLRLDFCRRCWNEWLAPRVLPLVTTTREEVPTT